MARRGRGEGSVRRRADGRWEARIWVELPTGARVRRSVFAATQREAQSAALEARDRTARGLPAAPEQLTVGEWLDRWLADVVRPRARPATLTSYENSVRTHLRPALGRVALTRLRPDQVEGLLRRMEDGGSSARTRQYALSLLRSALREAERRGLLSRNAAALVRAPRVERRELRPLDPAQARAFLARVAGHELEALFLVALAAGLRQGELLGLRWADVDLESGTLRVVQAAGRVRISREPPVWELQLGPTKSATSRRSLPIGSLVVAALRAHRARQAEVRLRAGAAWQDLDLVFAAEDGGIREPKPVYRAFREAMQPLEAAGAQRQRFHDLRHACASLLLLQGAGLKEVQVQLGHSTIGITADTYAHLYDEARRATAERMDAALAPAETPARPR